MTALRIGGVYINVLTTQNPGGRCCGSLGSKTVGPVDLPSHTILPSRDTITAAHKEERGRLVAMEGYHRAWAGVQVA